MADTKDPDCCDTSYRVVQPVEGVLSSAGFAGLEGMHFIFDGNADYHRNANEFLIDRALGLWDPQNRGKLINPSPPSRKSLETYADQLTNTLQWCEVRGSELLNMEYSADLIGRYRKDMLEGRWSRDGVRLAISTVNGRIDTATDFLTWAGDKGRRAPFVVPTVTKLIPVNAATSSVRQFKKVQAKVGKARIKKRRIGLPGHGVIDAWRDQIRRKPIVGETEALIAGLILETAIRREEAACWRNDTLPIDPKDWKLANADAPEEDKAVLVTITFGCKGHEYGRDHGDKIGPEGIIRVPLHIARQLHEYRAGPRNQALREAIRSGKTLADQRRIREQTVHLFLDPTTGLRYTGEDIYEFWRSVPRPKGWTVHLARD